MPSSLRLGALLFAAVKADETSLMQDVKKSSKRNGKQMSALMESAKGMLKSGATPDIVDFTMTTLEEIADVVIPALVDETTIQQQALVAAHDQMRRLIDVQLPEWKEAIFQWSSEVEAASVTHKNCRDVEHGLCYDAGKRPCELALYNLWTTWVDEETALRETHNSIDGHFCPPGANGTLHAFRVDSVAMMNSYMRQKEIVDLAETAYDDYRPGCIVHHNNLDAQSAICNAAQSDLETKACSESRAVHQTLFDFEARYIANQVEIQTAWGNARGDELLRHHEYRQIKIVECLLERIHELNGRPCDEESGELDEQLSHCHAEGEALNVCNFGDGSVTPDVSIRYEIRDVNVFHDPFETPNEVGWKFLDAFPYQAGELTVPVPHVGSICLLYPEQPERPPFCQVGVDSFAASSVCLPLEPPHPCDPLWTSAQITPLPGYPRPEDGPGGVFSEHNPGCNAYPACGECDLSEFTVVQAEDHIDTAVILVDGCFEQNTEVEREVAHLSDGRTGAVRCCSHAGDTCDTDHLVDGCQTDVTFTQAVELCALNGERLCTQTEIEARVCCGTGCGHDGRKVWVAPQGSSIYGS